MRPDRKRRGQKYGQWGEHLAVVWLWLHGWRVLARRWGGRRHSGLGEIDLVACRGRTLIFVEVKFRRTAEEAAHAMTPRQWRRQERTVWAFLAAHPHLMAESSWRLDLILLSPWRWPRHITGAWSVS